jgi:hypothetical protein
MKTPNIDPHKIAEVPHKIKGVPEPVMNKFVKKRESVFSRFPLLFTLLGTFGVVSTLYGFEHALDKIKVFVNNPLIPLGVGLATLILTGTLYKKLD